MRKIFLMIGLVFILLMVGCSASKDMALEGVLEDIEEEIGLADYFPFLENMIFEYEGFGLESASKSIYFEYIDKDRAQIKLSNQGTELVKLIEIKDGAIREIYSEGEFYHIENLLDIEAKDENILLKEPLELGNFWEIANGDKREITGIDHPIETPYGSFSAIEVTRFKKEGQDLDYYVQGLGLVASIYKDGGSEIKSLLKDVKNQRKIIPIEKYYPIDIDSDLVYTNGEIVFETNFSIEDLIEEILKNPGHAKLIPLISPKTKLNFIKMDRNNWRLRADFSPELITDMNYGAAMESKIISSLVNTLGRLYDVEGVIITIDGGAYESGHLYFKEDEALEVDIEGIAEFKP